MGDLSETNQAKLHMTKGARWLGQNGPDETSQIKWEKIPRDWGPKKRKDDLLNHIGKAFLCALCE